ncbi:MAG TPA: hypothetical protein VHD15_15570 [Hyphomicrobiales bacterium]|nr:hypothetical protein [Hyphomicrobiales bacterium]
MPEELETLVVNLEANVAVFQQKMEAAAAASERSTSKILSDFRSVNSGVIQTLDTAATKLGGLTSAIGAGPLVSGLGLAGLVASVRETAEEFAKIGEAAERLGISTTTLQALQFAIKGVGGAAGDATEGLTRFSQEISQAAAGGGRLAPVLKANGVALRDTNGQLRSTTDLLGAYAELLVNAKSPQDAINLATLAFGREAGPLFIQTLRDGASSVEQATDKAQRFGVIADEQMIAKAREIDDAFSTLATNLKVKFGGAVVDVASEVAEKLKEIEGDFADFGNSSMFAKVVGFLTGHLPTDPFAPKDAIKFVPDAVSRVDNAFAITDQNPLGRVSTHTTNVPPPTGADRDAKAFDRDIANVEKQTAVLKAETETISLNTEAQAQAKIEAELLADAQAHHITITDQLRQKIDAESEAYARQAQALADAKLKMQEFTQLQEFAGQQMSDFFVNVVSGSESAKDALHDLLLAIARAAAQAALLGQGPLAGLFHTGTTSNGGVGGLIGGLVGLFTGGGGGGVGADDFGGANFGNDDFIGGNAGGTDYWRGGQTWVGENGPELLNLPRGSQIVPNHALAGSAGGVTVAPVYNIDARGSDANAAALIRNALEDNNKALRAALPGMIRDARAHSRIH